MSLNFKYVKIFFFCFVDAIEFQMSYDRRTGRPIACALTRMDKESITFEVLSEEKFTGSVVQEAKPNKNKNVSSIIVKI